MAPVTALTITQDGLQATRICPAIITDTTAHVLPGTIPSCHHYVFTLYALDTDKLPLTGRFSGQDVIAAMKGHILDKASITGVYSLNPAVKLPA